MLFDTILEGAVRVLEESGVDEFNTRSVADRAGVSVGSVYQYFGSKDAIMAEIVLREHKRLLSVLDAALKSCATSDFEDAMLQMFENTSSGAPSRKLYRILEVEEDRLPRTPELVDIETAIVNGNRKFFGHYLSGKLSEDRIAVAALDIFKIIRALNDGHQAEVDPAGPDALPKRVLRAVNGYISSLTEQ